LKFITVRIIALYHSIHNMRERQPKLIFLIVVLSLVVLKKTQLYCNDILALVQVVAVGETFPL